MENWYEIKKLKDHLYIIRERLDLIDQRFYTKFTNLFLILGTHSAILFDTGCGIYDFTSLIRPIIEDRELLVINSHSHFDHVGGNRFF